MTNRNGTVANHQVNANQKHNEVLINELICYIKYLKINEKYFKDLGRSKHCL